MLESDHWPEVRLLWRGPLHKASILTLKYPLLADAIAAGRKHHLADLSGD
jgi:hypothetical protein